MEWTTLSEEEGFLAALDATNSRVTVATVGQSVQGRPIRAVRLGTPPPAASEQVALLVVALQHGTEPASREGALQLIDWLATTSDPDGLSLLHRGVVVVPTASPDGFVLNRRTNVNGVNLNRDHVQLSQPETLPVAAILAASRPWVVVDLHESINNISPSNIAEFAAPDNPQIAGGMVGLASQLVGAMQDRADQDSWPHGIYSATDYNTREGALAQTAGLRHRVGVLVETNRTDDSGSGRELRVEVQVAMAQAAAAWTVGMLAEIATEAQQSAQAKSAEGVAGAVAFNLRSAILNPPPLAYQLTAQQMAATALHRASFGIVGDGLIPMGQPAQPVIPFIMDGASDSAVVDGVRLFELPSDPDADGDGVRVAQAQARTEVTWLAVRATDGQVIEELPGLEPDRFGRLIGHETTCAHRLPIPTVGPRGATPAQRADLAVAATEPYRTVLVAVINDVPAWAGIVVGRTGGTGEPFTLSCATPEGYLARRLVRDHTFQQVDEADVMVALAQDAEDIDGLGRGLGLVYDAPPTGRLVNDSYAASDGTPVLQRMQERAGRRNGLEFTIDVDWKPGMEGRAVRFILRLGRGDDGKLGARAVGPRPNVWFDSRGDADLRYRFREDYSDGQGANWVQAYAPGEGDDQPTSTPTVASDLLDEGMLLVQRRWQPSSSITSQQVLDDHASRELDLTRHGARLFDLDVRWDADPRYGLDWFMGDDAAWRAVSERHPRGITGLGRILGWDLDLPAGRMHLVTSVTSIVDDIQPTPRRGTPTGAVTTDAWTDTFDDAWQEDGP